MINNEEIDEYQKIAYYMVGDIDNEMIKTTTITDYFFVIQFKNGYNILSLLYVTFSVKMLAKAKLYIDEDNMPAIVYEIKEQKFFNSTFSLNLNTYNLHTNLYRFDFISININTLYAKDAVIKDKLFSILDGYLKIIKK